VSRPSEERPVVGVPAAEPSAMELPATELPATELPATELPAMELLARGFFDRPATEVAPELLGCVLVHSSADGVVAAELVEVEAYMGSADPASHAFRGITGRNEVMFGDAGHSYVYFTYGMHFCVNLVCQPAGVASAVLLRAGRIVAGGELAAARRLGGAGRAAGAGAGRTAGVGAGGVAGAGRAGGAGAGRAASAGATAAAARRFEQLASGPARLCQALGIARAQNGLDVCDPAGELRICAPAGFAGLSADRIATGPRVGVSSGAEVPWRYWVAGDRAVSAYRPHVPRNRTAGAVAK
jgi:DNA-3-methyladenine glycosylase